MDRHCNNQKKKGQNDNERSAKTMQKTTGRATLNHRNKKEERKTKKERDIFLPLLI